MIFKEKSNDKSNISFPIVDLNSSHVKTNIQHLKPKTPISNRFGRRPVWLCTVVQHF